MSRFAIPPEFVNEVVLRSCADDRTDAEILTSLSEYRAVKFAKNVWCFWDKGIAAIEAWC